MPEEGEENEKVQEPESEKVAEPLAANKKRIEANKPILTYHVLSSETEVFSREWKHGLKRARGVVQKRRASIPSKGWKVSFKGAFRKREKRAK